MSLAGQRKIFLWVAVPVFAAVFGLSALLTLMQPRTYAGLARVDLKGLAGRNDATTLQAQADMALSETVLNPVVQKLDLNAIFGRDLRVAGALKNWESVTFLKQKLSVTPVEDANAVEISMIYENNSDVPARIANSVAETYCSVAAGGLRAEVTRRAHPAAWPEHPNIRLNLVLGAFGGLALALVLGGGTSWLMHQLNQPAENIAAKDKTT